MGAAVMVLIEALRTRFDYVLFDSAPVLQFADARVLAQIVDGVVLVVRGGSTEREVALRARQLLQQVDARIVGVVLNQADFSAAGYGYQYYDKYHAYYHDDESTQNAQDQL